VSPLPPPVTRGLYRSHWFEFLNAHLEDDAGGAAAALAELQKTAQGVGIRSLSDFARTATYLGRVSEGRGRFERARRAYDAAVLLDSANCDAQFARLRFLLRQRSFERAAAALPDTIRSLWATRESRLEALSAVSFWLAAALAAATLASVLVLLARHGRFPAHDVAEIARRFLGRGAAVPFAVLVLALPLVFGLGPVWLLLYWGALIYPSCEKRERVFLALALVALGLVPALAAAVSRENILERSPLYVAAVDLMERREDASAEDGLRQAAAVFGEDEDVWLLLGIYAERSADLNRALAAYDRAVRAAPGDYRPFLNRGNVRFQEGDFARAVRDYEAAAEKAPGGAEAYYNLALARAELYDFNGQTEALQRARQASARDVDYWTGHPTLARVVAAGYPLSRARWRLEEWNSQPRGGRLPGYAPASRLVASLTSPFAIGPWAALALAFALTLLRTWRGMAVECLGCARPYCKYCRRYGDPPGSCSRCAELRRRSRGIDVQMQRAEEARRQTRQRDRLFRFVSIFLPGAHRYFSRKPVSGFAILLLFFFLVAAGAIDGRLFSLRPLAPASSASAFSIAALAGAAAVWIVSLRAAFRESHGT
jgi:tetratricopeptide (TPR) repeat protein